MPHDPKLLDYLETCGMTPWSGTVYRYTAGGRPPHRENTFGARWNPRGVAAIYTTLARDTALAELRHHLTILSPPPSRTGFTLYTIQISAVSIVDLSTVDLACGAGITSALLCADDFTACQNVGGAARWLGAGGLLVPSARHGVAANLVIFPEGQAADFEFEVVAEEPLTL